jgi:hypothetical protein
MKNKINKEGRGSMKATPTRPSNTLPPVWSPAKPFVKTTAFFLTFNHLFL